MRVALDRMAKAAARRLLAWVAQRVDPTRLLWLDRRQHMVNATYRYGPVLLHGLSEVYLTTQVKPLAVNGVPLAQLLQTKDNLQTLINKFTGIQGYGLAHGQFPSSTGIQFSAGEGGTGPDGTGHEDQYVGVRPPGRLLDAHDANSLNVLIPLESVPKGPGWPSVGCCQGYYTYNGDTITVQSLITGQVLGLHVVGEYIPEDGTATPLFGKILADDSVVQTLSGGHPSYAYGLHLNMNQLQTVFERLHSSVPTAQLYDFLTDPTGPDTEPGYSRPTPQPYWTTPTASSILRSLLEQSLSSGPCF
jgi:hypothetical protein